MTSAAPARTTTAPPTRLPWPPRALLMPLVILGASLLTRGFSQAVTPFIRHDDWPFLVPADTPGVTSVAEHDLYEGRWLNTLWWAVIGQHGTPTSASLTYAVAYALAGAGMWRVLHLSGIRPRPAVDALLGVALFCSAVWVQLLYWPGALTPSVVVAAVALWTLPWAARSRWRLGLWLVIGEACAVLTYPPVGVLLVLFAVLLLRGARWRAVLAVVAGWGAGFGLGVATAYTLNWIDYGYFGIKIAYWRDPNPLTSLGALVTNVGRWAEGAGTLWASQWWVAVVGAVAVVLGLRDAVVRPRMQRLVAALAVAGGLDAALALVTGVVTENRGQLWSWYVGVLPVALLLMDRGGRTPEEETGPRSRTLDRVATAGLVVLVVGGVLAWRTDVGDHQQTRAQYAAIAEAATRVGPDGQRPFVVIYMEPTLRHSREGGIMAGTMRMAVRSEQDGLLPVWCAPDECAEMIARAASGSVIDLGRVGSKPHVVGVIVPNPPAWIY
ncbi:hypothetical protein FHX52_3959 [Humibacillus xanthopallidus]|uniref:4-amino-4-deoxy-L-arabinose transferase-like glycosyltransferase n=1 Tax=Humibacillus xanthopallidus TaxID=412689 RepID=A0A543PKZ5_9MICO|nr:hypothetical protein [Humibacillus xanthopallidus]TQN44738.1 hypothetical protein FHX52_3959 [Humibacillus xanthopallidus]